VKSKKYTAQQLLNDPSFIRWVKGKSDSEETEYWDEWVKECEKNRKISIQAQNKINGFAFAEPVLPGIQNEWERIRDKIEVKKRMGLVARNVQTGKRRDLLGVILKAAAVLLLGAFAGLFLYVYQVQEAEQEIREVSVFTLETGYGENKTINLTDGSAITLAARSKLTYKENWLDQPVKRVSLEGEAFFSISAQKNVTQPKFVVETEDGSASVWGTRFTVDTYGDGTKVVLEEGEVRVHLSEREEETESSVIIHPGEMATFSSSDSRITIEKVNPKIYTSWTTNELFFDNTPLLVLVERIKRTYGVEVKLNDPQMLNTKLSGAVDFRSLDGLITAVSEVLEIQIYKDNDNVIIGHK